MPRLVLVLCLCSFPGFAREGVLVQDGKSRHTIVLPRDASPAERRAAAEWQHYVAEMTGARLPILDETAANGAGPFVFVGRSQRLEALRTGIDFDRLGPEDFALKTVWPHLAIAGGRPRGTLYGVSTLLEKLGCRWFTRDVERIPRRSTLTIPVLNEVERPAFEMRWPGITEAVDKDWAARNKLNGGGLPLDASTGGRVECYPCGHSFHALIPPEKLFDAHPEYFALVDGRRRRSGAQLCLTNAGVIRQGIDQIFRWIAERPEVDLISVCQEDTRGWCECESCKRVEAEEGGAHSGPIVRFVNALAEAVSRKYPGKRILTYAYQYSEPPPARTRPHPAVRIQLAPISACVAHPAERCPRNQALLMDNLRGWAKLTNQIYMYGYATNFSHFIYPFPDFYRLAGDLPMFRRIGVAGVYYEGSHQGEGGEGAEMRAWVMAKLMWNPAGNVSALVDEFLEGVYGKAAPPMREVFDLLHRQVRFPPEGAGRHLFIDQAPWLPPEVVEQARPLYARALSLAETEAARRRMQRASLWVEYSDLLLGRRYTVRDGWYAPSGIPEWSRRFARFWQTKNALGIGLLNNNNIDIETEFPKRLAPYRVLTIENDTVRVDIVPDLSARAIRWIDKRTGRNLLREPSPAGVYYPNGSGLMVAIHPDPGGDAFDAEWRIETPPGGRALVLTGALKNGLVIRRTLSLPPQGASLRTENRIENRGAAAKDVEVLARFDTGPRDPDRVVSEARPGELALHDPDSGLRVTGRYSPEQVKRPFAGRDDRHGNRASLVMWSPVTRLAPGEHLRLDVEYAAAFERR